VAKGSIHDLTVEKKGGNGNRFRRNAFAKSAQKAGSASKKGVWRGAQKRKEIYGKQTDGLIKGGGTLSVPKKHRPRSGKKPWGESKSRP